MGFPRVKEVIIDDNPITNIEGSAFRDCPDLKSLSLNNIKLPNYNGDLRFLRLCTNLERLAMSGCFTEKDLADISAFPDLFNMKRFVMRGVGLIRTNDLHFKMPVLEVLDLQDNRLFEVETIDDLCNYTSLVEVNFAHNPLQVHTNLVSMIQDANPMLEVINKRQVHDIGYKEQEEIRQIRRQVIEYENPTVGTTMGDQVLAEGADDYAMSVEQMREQLQRIDKDDEKSQGPKNQEDIDRIVKIAKEKNELIRKVDEALQKKNDAAIETFERNQVRRLQALCPETQMDKDRYNDEDEMYADDARQFMEQQKKQFVDYRSKFRSIMNELRGTHYDDFAKIGLEKER